jgi:hypothetical protein
LILALFLTLISQYWVRETNDTNIFISIDITLRNERMERNLIYYFQEFKEANIILGYLDIGEFLRLGVNF